MRLDDVWSYAPAGCCSPRHEVPSSSRDKVSNCDGCRGCRGELSVPTTCTSFHAVCLRSSCMRWIRDEPREGASSPFLRRCFFGPPGFGPRFTGAGSSFMWRRNLSLKAKFESG